MSFFSNPLKVIKHAAPALIGGALFGPLGAIGGSLLGKSLFGGGGQSSPSASPIGAPASKTATQRGFNIAGASMPSFLSGQGISDPLQQRTALATEAVSGGGAADQDRDYFLKLIMQGLQGNQSNFTPVEGSYLGRLGLPTNNNSDLLRILSG